MTKKLTKHGNSLALIIDKPILELLKINQDTELSIVTNGTSITIEPVNVRKKRAVSDDTKMQKIYEKLVKRYDVALKKLATK